jgi:hypothetical protein
VLFIGLAEQIALFFSETEDVAASTRSTLGAAARRALTFGTITAGSASTVRLLTA